MPNLNVGLGLALVSVDAWALEPTVQCFVDEGGIGIGCSDVARTITCTNETYIDCNTCRSGYTRSVTTITVSSNESYTIGVCTKNTVSCPSTCSSESWTTSTNGREVRCVKSSSTATCEYRCAAGYYGSGTSCASCQGAGSYNGLIGTSSAGSTSVSSCCILRGSTFSFSDDKGSGTATISSTCCAS